MTLKDFLEKTELSHFYCGSFGHTPMTKEEVMDNLNNDAPDFLKISVHIIESSGRTFIHRLRPDGTIGELLYRGAVVLGAVDNRGRKKVTA